MVLASCGTSNGVNTCLISAQRVAAAGGRDIVGLLTAAVPRHSSGELLGRMFPGSSGVIVSTKEWAKHWVVRCLPIVALIKTIAALSLARKLRASGQ
jgi:hypothetical protein